MRRAMLTRGCAWQADLARLLHSLRARAQRENLTDIAALNALYTSGAVSRPPAAACSPNLIPAAVLPTWRRQGHVGP